MQEIKDFMAVSTQRGVEQARARIERIRAALPEFDLVCSGTLVRRMIKCGRPNCRCASDPESRHGPYWQWGHMRAGKPTHRYVSEQQATVLRQALAARGNCELLRCNMCGV